MRERVQEQKAAARRGLRADKADGESAVLAKIAAMPEADRAIGERIHAIVRANAPVLSPEMLLATESPADVALAHFHSSTISGSASCMIALHFRQHLPAPVSKARESWRQCVQKQIPFV